MPYGPCNICGATNYPMSMGGPFICPSCDCGNFGFPVVERQGKELVELREREKQFNEALNYFYSGDGLDEAALKIQNAINPIEFLDGEPKPDHAVQVGIRMLINAIRQRAGLKNDDF